MSKIKSIKAREIMDSRAMPTVEVDVVLDNGICGTFAVPSGASTGSKEALELRDGDKKRFHGKGVLKAVSNVNDIIAPAIIGMEVKDQKSIDEKLLELDGTENKSKLGANAILGVSIASLKAAALDDGKELYEYLNKREKKTPYAMFNIVNGGKHAFNNIDIQEFMIVPKFKEFKDIVRVASEVFYELKAIMEKNNMSTGVGDEGGFAPNLDTNSEALDLIVEAITNAGYVPNKDVYIALDCAASSFFNKETNRYEFEKKSLTTDELLEYYKDIVKKYPIISIEDPFDEDDIEGFKKITEVLGHKIMIVGDDLFVTNKKLLTRGIEEKWANAILIKPNQIGTFYEMLETVILAKKNNINCIISHRSGETVDTFIADAAVALSIPYIKTGSISRGERIAKYNRLMRIEENLESK